LTVTSDDNGATATATKSVTVVNNVAPTAAAQVSPTTGFLKTGITNFSFTSTGSADSDGTIASYDWDFGDGSSHAATASASHIYSVAGTFTATLTVTDNNGATGTATKSVTVVDNVFPTTAPTVDVSTGTTATNFHFDAHGADSDGTVASYFWAFGDGTFASTATPTKKYTTPGTYNATVTVTDNDGAQTSASVTVTVS
jgi:PKD repeat protein